MVTATLARLFRSPVNLALLAAAAFIVADAVIVLVGVRGDWAFDFTCCYQQAGQRLLEDPASLYAWSETYTYRYSPWAAVPFALLAPLTEAQAVLAWLLLKIAVLGVLAAWFARTQPSNWRVPAMLAVLFFPPVWHDLVLGNVSVFTLGVLLALLRWEARAGGVAFGLLLLLAPKPHLVPVGLWLLVRRPRAAIAALLVLAAGLLGGVALFGIGPWLAYLGTFAEPLAREFTANVGFSGLLPGPLGVGLGVAGAVVLLAMAFRRDDRVGFGISIASGVLLGPYTFIHYLAGLVVAAEPALRLRPRWLAPFPWLLVVFPLIPVWVALFGVTLSRLPRDPFPEAERRGGAPG